MSDRPDFDQWLSEPYTLKMRADFERKAKGKLTALIGACRQSHDPDIIKAYAEYESMEKMWKLFRGESND
jgi:hypothetical protein